MTDDERDALLTRLERKVDALDDGQVRIEGKVDRIMGIVQSQAAARIETDGRVADHERRIEALERQAG